MLGAILGGLNGLLRASRAPGGVAPDRLPLSSTPPPDEGDALSRAQDDADLRLRGRVERRPE